MTSTETGERTTLGQLAVSYLQGRVDRRELDPMTARNHRSALVIFAREVGGEPCQVDVTSVEQWLATRRELAPATRRSQFSMVKHFCGWLYRRGYIPTNPVLEVRGPRVPRSVPRALAEEKVTRLLSVAPDSRARVIVWLMVGLGLRCVEVSRLELGDWDDRSRTLLVRGKFGHERMLPIPAEVTGALTSYLAEFPASAGPLVRSYRQPTEALRADTISGMVSEWMRAARVKVGPLDGVAAHALRHTAASDVLDRCGDVRLVQNMLGHSSVATTSIYLRRASLGQLRDAMEGRDYRT